MLKLLSRQFALASAYFLPLKLKSPQHSSPNNLRLFYPALWISDKTLTTKSRATPQT